MTLTPALRSGALGAALINIASMLFTLNLLGWIIFGMSMRPAIVWIAIYCVGIIVHAVEPAKAIRRTARR